MTKTKICGITQLQDARVCAGYGANYLGFIQYEDSPRYVEPAVAKEIIGRVAGAQPDLGFLRLDPAPWDGVQAISVDYAVMERADTLAVLRLDTQWSDLGSWDTVAQASVPDAQGNVLSGDALALDCAGTLLRAEAGTRQVLVGLGLRDIIAVAMPDAVLVAHKDRAQDVKSAVAT